MFLWIGRFNPEVGWTDTPVSVFRSLFLWIGRFNQPLADVKFSVDHVSILVLVDRAIQPRTALRRPDSAQCFDPCSCGSGDSTIRWDGRSGFSVMGFDPCSCGSGDSTGLIMMLRRSFRSFDPCSCGSGDSTRPASSLMACITGFDPCSCGSGDSTRGRRSFPMGLIKVSILVLVDRAIQQLALIGRALADRGFDPCSCGSGDST